MFVMQYKNYTGQVEFDDEAGLFHGHVANLREVITFQGTSVSELREALADSVEDYLEFCASRGEAPEHVKSGEAELREDLIRTYGRFNKVRAIAMGKYLEEQRVVVVLSMDLYDGDLMGSLIDAEYDLHGRFPGLCIDVHYIPVGDAPLEKYMYYNGTLIWQRDF